ncbi:MAG: dehydrogenase [Oligoflexia bacterium]|nr:dehydrogenase [Oligoflexia bacterium]
MFRIADLDFGTSRGDCWYEFDLAGQRFEVQKFGANFSLPYLKSLLVTLRNRVDAFAITNIPPVLKYGRRRYVHPSYLDIMNFPSSVPVCDGWRLRELCSVDSVSSLLESGQLDPRRGIFFPMGILHLELTQKLAENHRRHLSFGDAFAFASAPLVLTPDSLLTEALPLFAGLSPFRRIESQTPLARSALRQAARAAFSAQLGEFQYVIGDLALLLLWGDELRFITGKDVITPYSHPTFEERLKAFAPRSVTNLFPKEFLASPYLNYGVFEAAMMLAKRRSTHFFVEEWESILGIRRPESRRYVLGTVPSAQYEISSALHRGRRHALSKDVAPDFAFIVHALSKEDLFRTPLLKPLSLVPESWRSGLEKIVSLAPGFAYGHIKHIISPKNDREVSGIIYALGSTPRMLKEADPEATYRKIESLCQHAHSVGAKIMGLGAYTKIVGDSGITINRNSPIPVTTGNSLSASATLWAVHEIVRKLGLLTASPDSKRLQGTATVIGATGSIGKVSAKLLSLAYTRVCIVAPNPERLRDLAAELRVLSPDCEIIAATSADEVARLTDVLVTATSAFDQKIVDVELLKPGCIVCDCSRPLDFTEEDALKRPDILIIESGEVVLPGPVEMTCDLGLPPNTVYACLAETAILAMEGLYEPFTLGRDIDWLKVKQIYQLALAHGVKLAAIRGTTGLITDREIVLAREAALRKLRA